MPDIEGDLVEVFKETSKEQAFAAAVNYGLEDETDAEKAGVSSAIDLVTVEDIETPQECERAKCEQNVVAKNDDVEDDAVDDIGDESDVMYNVPTPKSRLRTRSASPTYVEVAGIAEIW